MAGLPPSERRVRIPTITDPRGTDFAAAHRLKHQPWMLDLERRAIAAFEALGVLMTNTCINYQTIMPPVRGEHVRLWRHRRGDLFEQRVRRALELRGRAVGAERRAHRPHAALRLSSRRAAAGNARRQCRLDAARAQRLGRARRHRRPAGRRLLAGPGPRRHRARPRLRRDEAFRRRAGELRLGRAVPHGRHHARGAAARRRRRSRTIAAHA